MTQIIPSGCFCLLIIIIYNLVCTTYYLIHPRLLFFLKLDNRRHSVYSEINLCTVSCSFSIKWKLFIYNFSLFTSRFILLSSYHDFILLYLTTQTYTGNNIELYPDYFAPQGYYNTNKVMSHVSFYSYISTLIHIAYRFSIIYTVSVIATFVH